MSQKDSRSSAQRKKRLIHRSGANQMPLISSIINSIEKIKMHHQQTFYKDSSSKDYQPDAFTGFGSQSINNSPSKIVLSKKTNAGETIVQDIRSLNESTTILKVRNSSKKSGESSVLSNFKKNKIF